jgi:hypothetical protein
MDLEHISLSYQGPKCQHSCLLMASLFLSLGSLSRYSIALSILRIPTSVSLYFISLFIYNSRVFQLKVRINAITFSRELITFKGQR